MNHQNLRLGKCWKLFWATLNNLEISKNSEEKTLAGLFVAERTLRSHGHYSSNFEENSSVPIDPQTTEVNEFRDCKPVITIY